MGIRGLQTFIEKFCPPNCYYEVSIEQLVEEYKRQTGGKEPVIVVDGSSCLGHIYKGLDWVSGGQYKEYIEKLGKFVQAFKQIGVKLVFYFGGGTVNPKRKEWIKRCFERLERVYQMFDQLSDGLRTTDLHQSLFSLPPGVGTLSQHYLEHIFGCEVYQSVDETDTEIAHYARERKCLAIFGQDSDYLIYEGGTYYLSAQHFNLRTMRTFNYDRRGFAEYLGLETSQLPLFATLAGNDLVSFSDLKPFHRFLCRKYTGGGYDVNFKTLFPALARYIQQFPPGEAVIQALPHIAREALNDPRAANVFATSIRSYLSSTKIVKRTTAPNHPHWNAVLQRAEELHRSNYSTATVFAIVNGEPFETSTAFEDYRERDLPPFARLLRPMRTRLYGILFHEKPLNLEPQFVLEWCMEGPNSLNEPTRIKPAPPSDPHPGLLALWSDDRTQDLQNARWQLFAHGISSRLNPAKLRHLPQNLVLPTAVMFYIVDNRILATWEIEAMIATVVTLPTVPLERLASLPSDPVDLRAVRIATIYMRSLWSTIILLSACGYPLPPAKTFIHPYFDGKLFQQKYRKAKDKASHAILCGHQVTSIEAFLQVRQVLFENAG
ncbi:unnamed protein product [Bemisia tabaci]|uniref:Constitutive coactivator of peroxisome proliferator-activated receptor gamma n=1 Tax=Bemisia tabaci TaxID=7038 RepID=A0A9P0F4E3_BEMTA|nr:unnamed protein product [Bemisia tabaci]